jgi:hypothetical protein
MTDTRIVVASVALAVVSCTSAAPIKINQGDLCFRCQRSITDTRLAAQQTAHFYEKFRAPGCMAKYLVNNPGDRGAILVTDYATGKTINPEKAFFVRFIVDDRTGERDYRAYMNKNDADAFAAEAHTTPVDWKAVLHEALTQG